MTTKPPQQALRQRKGHRRAKAFSRHYRRALRDEEAEQEVVRALSEWLRRRRDTA